MKDYQKINVITGWAMFVVSLVVYLLTLEPTASFWDCGEFIASSYKLEVPHPPGAPFFLLIGRMFSMLASDVDQVAYWVNVLSALSAAFTILFLFWSVTHLAKKVVKVEEGEDNTFQTILVMGAGVVAALTCTFSDSFWFSAVEAEVYAMSSFFTAFVFWAILKWENIEDESFGNKWLILIAYMMGLSIGVHLLNLVAIPALGLIYYFKKNEEVTTPGIIKTLVISGAIIILILIGVIPGLPSIAASFEIFFVNSLGLPFYSGIVFFGLLFVGALVAAIIYSIKKQNAVLNTALLAFAFVLIGYSSYSVVLVRSNYNPPIDENDPENILTFVSYLKREQYGNRPLFKGPYFTASSPKTKKGATVYMKGEDEYVVKDYKIEYDYNPKDLTILPRMYSTQPSHIQRYRQYANLGENEKPGMFDNLSFMWNYQIKKMYLRYFMWNFSGRESDQKEAKAEFLEPLWKEMPGSIENNKGRNIYYGIPLILGLIGAFFQFRKDMKNFAVTGLLFFLTGLALVLYLNSPPSEPRERDYIYAGSYYVFTFWVGFGVLGLFEFIGSLFKQNKVLAAGLSVVLSMAIPTIMVAENWDDHDRSDRYFSIEAAKNYLDSCAPNAILFTGGDNDTFPLWYAQEVEGHRTDVRVIVLSYFNTDWYINQMMRDAYESKAVPFTLTSKNYIQGGFNDAVLVTDQTEDYINTPVFLEALKREAKQLQLQASSWSTYNTIPGRNMFLNVDAEKVRSMGIVPDSMEIIDRMAWRIKGRALEKKDLAIVDIIATNNWERPIYFNTTSLSQVNIDISRYAVLEGLTYRLLPIKSNSRNVVSTDVMYDNMMNNFHWKGLQDSTVYYSEDYRNFALNHRASFSTLSDALIAEGKYDKARDILLKCVEVIPDASIPYDNFNVAQIGNLLEVGEEEVARDIADVTAKRAEETLIYLEEYDLDRPREKQLSYIVLSELTNAFKSAGDNETAKKYDEILKSHLR